MEAIIKSSSVHDNGCNGCIRHKSDIMVTFATDPKEGEGVHTQFNDFFLTEQQAEKLIEQLQTGLEYTRKNKYEHV